MKESVIVKKFIKIFVNVGFLISITALASSLVLQIFAVKSENYYLFNEMSIQLIHTARQCAATTSLGGFLFKLLCE